MSYFGRIARRASARAPSRPSTTVDDPFERVAAIEPPAPVPSTESSMSSLADPRPEVHEAAPVRSSKASLIERPETRVEKTQESVLEPIPPTPRPPTTSTILETDNSDTAIPERKIVALQTPTVHERILHDTETTHIERDHTTILEHATHSSHVRAETVVERASVPPLAVRPVAEPRIQIGRISVEVVRAPLVVAPQPTPSPKPNPPKEAQPDVGWKQRFGMGQIA